MRARRSSERFLRDDSDLAAVGRVNHHECWLAIGEHPDENRVVDVFRDPLLSSHEAQFVTHIEDGGNQLKCAPCLVEVRQVVERCVEAVIVQLNEGLSMELEEPLERGSIQRPT